jgi:hypothetical protein
MDTITKEKLLGSFVEVKSIYLHARRWFQRSYGNTYHTCEIWVNDRMVHKIPFTYGYGDQWEWNAQKWLVDNSFLDRHDSEVRGYHYPISRYCRESGIEYNNTVTDVNRKRDL